MPFGIPGNSWGEPTPPPFPLPPWSEDLTALGLLWLQAVHTRPLAPILQSLSPPDVGSPPLSGCHPRHSRHRWGKEQSHGLPPTFPSPLGTRSGPRSLEGWGPVGSLWHGCGPLLKQDHRPRPWSCHSMG